MIDNAEAAFSILKDYFGDTAVKKPNKHNKRSYSQSIHIQRAHKPIKGILKMKKA